MVASADSIVVALRTNLSDSVRVNCLCQSDIVEAGVPLLLACDDDEADNEADDTGTAGATGTNLFFLFLSTGVDRVSLRAE